MKFYVHQAVLHTHHNLLLDKLYITSLKEKWFKGLVVSFDDKTEMQEVAYDEEEDHYFFNLLEDISW